MSLKDLYPAAMRVAGPVTDTVNSHGFPAYKNSPEWRLAKALTTGMAGSTFYTEQGDLNLLILEAAIEVDDEFLAKAIVYARQTGNTRANPIQLLALLSARNPKLFRVVFKQVIQTGGDLLDFATVVLSGVFRQGFGTAPREEMRAWLNSARPYQFLKYGSNHQDPSLADVLKLVRPTPVSPERAALFAWILGKDVNLAELPETIQLFEEIQALKKMPLDLLPEDPDVDGLRHRSLDILASGKLPHEVVTPLKLSPAEWKTLAVAMPHMATLRNLNTFARQGVFDDPAAVAGVAGRLGDEHLVLRSRVFPFRYLTAYQSLEDSVPRPVRQAVSRALEMSCRNVPVLDSSKDLVVAVDVSASMGSPIYSSLKGRKIIQTKTRVIDVAALVAAAVTRSNPHAMVVPFDHQLHDWKWNPDDTITTNAQKLADFRGGGTDTSLVFQHIARTPELARRLGVLVAVTDGESWLRPQPVPAVNWALGVRGHVNVSPTLAAWNVIRRHNPEARAILVSVTPSPTEQLPEIPGITFVSGFSDDVFKLIGRAYEDESGLVDAIRQQTLDTETVAC